MKEKKTIHIKGYKKSDGTRVKGYDRKKSKKIKKK